MPHIIVTDEWTCMTQCLIIILIMEMCKVPTLGLKELNKHNADNTHNVH